MTTWNDVLAWAKTVSLPNGDCQGFVGNHFTAKYGSFKDGYSSANAALAASKAAGTFHANVLPPDGKVVYVYFDFPVYGHVMLYFNGTCLGDTSHAKTFLNKGKTIGTMTIAEYPYKYLGYSTSNGVNTIPAIPTPAFVVEHNLTEAEVKIVAAYLNGRKLGKTTTADKTGINMAPGTDSSNYYWEIQEAANKDGLRKGGVNGQPGAGTYDLEKAYLKKLTPPATTPTTLPASTNKPPVVVVSTPSPLLVTEEQMDAIKALITAFK